jgi:hypothetical protein
MNIYMALGNAGKDVLIIKDDKIIGRGHSELSCQEFVGVSLCEGELADKLKNLEPFKTIGELKHVFIRYAPVSGVFLGFDFQDECPEAEAILEGSLAVNEFDFGYKMVPDHFKTAEGYGASIERDAQTSVSAEEKELIYAAGVSVVAVDDPAVQEDGILVSKNALDKMSFQTYEKKGQDNHGN